MNLASGTVFIVDDIHEVRVALARVLMAADYRVRTFESAERFLEEQDGEEPGCLLLDICLPGLTGIELQHALDGSPYARPIVFLTGMGDIPTSVQAMKAGAVDFLTKPIDCVKLVGAIEQALRRDARQRMERAIRIAIEERINQLTMREREVMTRIICGRLNKHIAAEFGVGEKTVKVHRSRVMSKMRVRSVAELVSLAERVGIAIQPALGSSPGSFGWKLAFSSKTLPVQDSGTPEHAILGAAALHSPPVRMGPISPYERALQL